MGYVRHTYDSPTPNEEHDVKLEVKDIENLEPTVQKVKDDTEALNVFLQL
jgi:hypothetical protein